MRGKTSGGPSAGALAAPIYKLLKIVVPGAALESPHNRDLRWYALTWSLLLVAVAGVAMVLLAAGLYRSDRELFSFLSTILAAVAGLALSKIHAAAEAANRRQGAADIFFSDIVSICRVMYSLGLPQPYVWRYGRLDDPSGGLPTPGEEDYVNVFHDKCADLAVLDQKVVQQVTAFYRYFLSARDTARRLGPWGAMTPAERAFVLRAVMVQF